MLVNKMFNMPKRHKYKSLPRKDIPIHSLLNCNVKCIFSYTDRKSKQQQQQQHVLDDKHYLRF